MGLTGTAVVTVYVCLAVSGITASISASDSQSVPRHSECLDVEGYQKIVCMYPFELPKCSDSSGDKANTDVTVVSALYDLKREHWPHFKRHFNVYLYYTVQLMRLNAPLVIYVDKQETYDYIKWHRRGKENITRILIRPLETLEYYFYLDKIAEVMKSEQFQVDNALLKHPEGFSSEYNVLMSNKLSFIEDAIDAAYFNSDYFVWLDAGYAHGKQVYPDSCDWAPHNLMSNAINRDKVTYIEIMNTKLVKHILDIYKKHLSPFINGGYFSGSTSAMRRYSKVYRQVFVRMLEDGMTDDDQTLAVAAALEDPGLFNLVPGSWYDAFKMFT